MQTNNAWVSFINHDGSVHTARWIGVQNPGDQRDDLTPPLVLNEPFGSDIANGMLYVADRDGGTTPTEPSVAVIRRFNMQTGAPAGEIRVEKSTVVQRHRGRRRRDDLRDADRRRRPEARRHDAGRCGRSRPTATASIFVQGAPLRQPNGIAFDPQGNIVVVNIGNNEVLTFSPEGKLLKTENAAQAGNDGLVIMPDGTKYVSSVRERRRLADSSRPAGRAHRAEHPERGVDVLRRRRESAGDSDERQQRAGVHPAQVAERGTTCPIDVQ